MRAAGDFSESVGRGGGNGNGGDHAGFEHAEREQRGAPVSDEGLQRLREFGGFEIGGGHAVGEQRSGRDDGG